MAECCVFDPAFHDTMPQIDPEIDDIGAEVTVGSDTETDEADQENEEGYSDNCPMPSSSYGSSKRNQWTDSYSIEREDNSLRRFYRCVACGKSFERLTDYISHSRLRYGEMPYLSMPCAITFDDDRYFNNEMHYKRRNKSLKCETCGVSFLCSFELEAHITYHAENLPYGCWTCNKRLATESEMLTHINTHPDRRTYECSLCSDAIYTEDGLKKGIIVHSGEWLHECDIYDNFFASQPPLIYDKDICVLIQPHSSVCDTFVWHKTHLQSGNKPCKQKM